MDVVNNRKNQVLSALFMIALMVGTGYYIFSKQSFSSVQGALKYMDIKYIILGLLMMIIYVCCEGINIWMTIKSLNIKTNMLDSLGFAFLGFYFSSITPSASGGQPAQIYYMNKKGINISSSSLSLMVLLFAHQLVIIVFAVFAVIFKAKFVLGHTPFLRTLLIFGLVANGIILFFIFAMIYSSSIVRKMIGGLVWILKKMKILNKNNKLEIKIEKQIVEYGKGAQYIRNNPGLLIKVILVTVIQILALLIVPYFVYKGFGFNKFSFFDILGMNAILNISVSSLPLPGAVGISETAFLKMFNLFFGKNFLVPAMLITRIISFYLILIVSGIVTFIFHLKVHNKNIIS